MRARGKQLQRVRRPLQVPLNLGDGEGEEGGKEMAKGGKDGVRAAVLKRNEQQVWKKHEKLASKTEVSSRFCFY